MTSKPNRQTEAMLKFRCYAPDIELIGRVWLTTDTVRLPTFEEMRDTQAVADAANPTCKDIAEAVAKMPDVAAVEVTGPCGNGVIIYPDWS